jgi:hypothetical protein
MCFNINRGQIFYCPFWCIKKYRDWLTGSICPYFIFSVIHKCSFELISIVFFPCDVQLIWDRALGLPLERPKSVTMDWLDSYCKKAASP